MLVSITEQFHCYNKDFKEFSSKKTSEILGLIEIETIRIFSAPQSFQYKRKGYTIQFKLITPAYLVHINNSCLQELLLQQ